jgi:hypothetical protein
MEAGGSLLAGTVLLPSPVALSPTMLSVGVRVMVLAEEYIIIIIAIYLLLTAPSLTIAQKAPGALSTMIAHHWYFAVV